MTASASNTFPPGPTEPAVLQAMKYLRAPVDYLTHCQQEFGDIFTLKVSKQKWVFTSSPTDVKQIFSDHSDALHAGEAKARMFGIATGDASSLVLDGADHIRRRRLLLPRFKGEHMLAFTQPIRELTGSMVESWPRGSDFALYPMLHDLTLRTILRSVFGPEETARTPHLWEILERFANNVVPTKLFILPALQWNLGRHSPWGRVLYFIEETDRALYNEIRSRRENPDSDTNDIMTLLLNAQHEDNSLLSDREVRDELVAMIVAGHEITSKVVTWLFFAIISRPEVYRRVVDEIAEVQAGEALKEEHIPKLQYLETVVKESMRYYSTMVNGNIRLVMTPYDIHGYTLPEGTFITVALHLLHRRADLYADPDTFNPDRFANVKTSPYEWIPFGGGHRHCLGANFAMHQMKIVVATVLSSIRMEPLSVDVRPVRSGAFLAPQGGLLVRALDL